jgi:DNA-directed RNA polymerase subunit H (RpoH/RPB5)
MQQLFDVKKTQLAMVRDRGYSIGEDELPILHMNLDEFEEYIDYLIDTVTAKTKAKMTNREVLTHYYEKNDNGEIKKLFVYYDGKTSTQKQVPNNVIKKFSSLVSGDTQDAIIIVDAELSSGASKLVKEMTVPRIQIFFDKQLTFNPTTHVYTPRQELLSQEETDALAIQMKTELSKFPIILDTDPIVRYYGWPTNRLVRCYRDDSYINILNPLSIFYRVIIPDPKSKR